MTYVKTEWVDRVVEKPNTFTVTENSDGTMTLIPAPGQVIERGTPLNAENLNKIEDAIVGADTRLSQVEQQMMLVEEGEFTPVLCGSTVAGSHVYEQQIGRYQRIGRYCHIGIQMKISAGKGEMSGSILIKGLPFANRGVVASGSIGYSRGFGVGGDCQLGVYCEAGSTADYMKIMYSNLEANTTAYGFVNHEHLPENAPIEITLSVVIRVEN